jgi:hypothetical protein
MFKLSIARRLWLPTAVMAAVLVAAGAGTTLRKTRPIHEARDAHHLQQTADSARTAHQLAASAAQVAQRGGAVGTFHLAAQPS